MAKCKLCKKVVADDIEYCEECLDKKDLVSSESYLDDLLNSIQNNETSASDIYTKKKDVQATDSHEDTVPIHEESTHSIESEDVDDLHSIKSEDVDDSHSIESEDVNDFDQYDISNEVDHELVIDDEDLYDDLVDNLIDDIFAHEQTIENNEEQDSTLDNLEIENNIDNEFLDMDSMEELESEEDDSIDPFIDDLLEQLNLSSDENDSEEDIEVTSDDIEPEMEEIDQTPIQDIDISPESELLNLLNEFNPDNPVEDDVQAINELLGGIGGDSSYSKPYPEDVGDVFSEALEAVTSLSDLDSDLVDPIKEPDATDEIKGKKKKKRKEKKTGFFASKSKDEDKALTSDMKKAQDVVGESKKVKKKKKKANKPQVIATEEDEESRSSKIKEAKKDKKVKKDKKEKKRVKEEKRKARKEKKKIEIIELEEIDEGRISPVGTSVVFLFFGLLVMLLLVFTNIFSYSLSIRNASNYFSQHRYTQAYNEVYGIELKDEDIELYDKIMTVMYVNKQLNSYNNYFHMRKYPEALDSLLKGLQRYDKYIELATILGIETDLVYVRDQIIAELYNVFSLTEEEAINLLNSESQAKYSIGIYDVVLERMMYH
jgi:hypothetical protein